MTNKLQNLSSAELRAMVEKQAEVISQKDRQISHLSKNAQKWVQKFDEQQNKVAESVIKKFEMEFERERNELHAKLIKMNEMQTRLVKRYRDLRDATRGSLVNAENSADRTTEQPIEINMLVEQASVTEIEFSNEMQLKLAKYAT